MQSQKQLRSYPKHERSITDNYVIRRVSALDVCSETPIRFCFTACVRNFSILNYLSSFDHTLTLLFKHQSANFLSTTRKSSLAGIANNEM